MLNISKHIIRPEKENIQVGDYYIFELLKTPRYGRTLVHWMLSLIGIGILALFLPWQQNINGRGSLTAFTPADRPQLVYPTFSGRVDEWYVMEGQPVKKGTPIARLSEIKNEYFDPDIVQRTSQQLDAQQGTIDARGQKITALEDQISQLRQGLDIKLRMQQNKILQLLFKIQQDSANLIAERINYETAEAQFSREKQLLEEGLVSRIDMEEKLLKFQETQAKVIGMENKLATTQNELANARVDLSGIRAEYLEKIAKATSDRNETLAKLNEDQSKLAGQNNKLANLKPRQDYYIIRAPQDGFVVKSHKSGVGEIIKDTEPLVTVMPANAARAVELYVRAIDIPLIEPGTKVRVQFDGWPALVFSGWPNASIGTFGGIVRVVDVVNTFDNRYRILVTPDPEDDPWPDPDMLRIGSGAYGWAMLQEVPMWYEIWRQINTFPPLPNPNDKSKSKSFDLRKALK